MENYTDRRNCIKHKKIPARTVKLSWQVFYFESPSQSTEQSVAFIYRAAALGAA